MVSETESIQDDEWLLRHVQKDYFRTNKIPYMSDSTFVPRLRDKTRDPDIEGISLYRLSCLSSPMDILKPENYGKRGIVGVRVSELRRIGLSVRIDPEKTDNPDRINGHVVIPELSCDRYLEDKKNVKVILHKLAEIASADDHIFWDPNNPDPTN